MAAIALNEIVHWHWDHGMRLSTFIDENVEPILQAWEDFARTIAVPGKTLDADALRDHAGQMLQAIVNDLDTPQSKQQQLEKSQGNGPASDRQTAAQAHAVTRLMAGFTLDQMVSEYRALRTSVLSLWMCQMNVAGAVEIEDLARFHEAIDQALTESIANYSRAQEASRTLFLGILGHDLRNPLGAILLGADMLLRNGELCDKFVAVAGQVHASAKRANRIVGDLLDFTRSHLGPTLPVRLQAVDLVAVCKRIVSEERAVHPLSDIRCEVTCTGGGRFDEARMEQVFSNLISNAVHHGKSGAPVTVAFTSDAESYVFSVHNLGQPIADDVLPFIFDPMGRFLRPGVSDLGPLAGIGLGLYIASQIVAAHGGQIDVTSSGRKGTTFKVRLPR